ncbi:HD domain-containing protein [Amphibacillus sp. Q70]|uniref:HD domain-containing protein n=1 Tax=Amphibacillus sp. Q70 TaxID=3453416 RepID=UPI003F85BE56
MNQSTEQINLIKAYVSDAFLNDTSGHDFEHMKRVAHLAKKIAIDEKENPKLCEIAGWVHDLIDDKLVENVANSKADLHALLKRAGLTIEECQSVFQAIEAVSFRKSQTPKTQIGKIVQDADRLDALGAIGIARAFSYGSIKGQPIYGLDGHSTLEHFSNKLFKLKDLLHTRYAKELAIERHQVLKQFYLQFKKEWHEANDLD